ncbi:probable WRKY transcription factor 46 [Jatropha curcas]|uniref:probable WRKY transcription factor 46 n=1 Tax=Jatropha curcas TaxID=180498 RepID=UPI001893C0C8|nr:probable WRKY transcription factor 46 [Jatropha curcas]
MFTACVLTPRGVEAMGAVLGHTTPGDVEANGACRRQIVTTFSPDVRSNAKSLGDRQWSKPMAWRPQAPGYYSCTHRHSQGCLCFGISSQVQRSDQDPTIFEVTYRGRHTCFQAARLAASINDKSQQGEDNCSVERQQQHKEVKPKLLKEISFNYREGLSKSEDLEIFLPFSLNEENDIFKESIMENDFFVNFSPAFISPATSSGFGIDNNARTPESNSAPTSVTNSPIGDWDLSIDSVDFDSTLPLELFG